MIRTDPPLLPPRIATRVLAIQATLALVVGLAFLVCYAGLQRDPQPHHVSIAVVGQANAAGASAGFGERAVVTAVADDQAARQSVLRQDAVAALSTATDGTIDVYTAGANGVAENAAAEQLAQALAHHTDARVSVVDLVPTLRLDPRGLASFYVALSATVASFILAQAMFALRQIIRLRGQLLTLVVFAATTGVAIAVVAGPVLGVVPVSVVVLAPLLALLSLAVSLTSRALIAWLGPVGITLATLAMTAVGLSTSGGILSADLLPWPLGAVGAVLPPGAAFRAIVSLGYFDGRHAVLPLATLAGWVVLALGALRLHSAVRGRG